jgi:hypothetical protein
MLLGPGRAGASKACGVLLRNQEESQAVVDILAGPRNGVTVNELAVSILNQGIRCLPDPSCERDGRFPRLMR